MCDSTLFQLEEKKSLWIQTYFTLNLENDTNFFLPGNDILLVKSASQPSTSMRWWILITKTPEKKSPVSIHYFSSPAFVKIMQQKTYVIFWYEKMILASNLLNSTYFVTWFLQKQKKKRWEIMNDYPGLFLGFLCVRLKFIN